MAISTPNLYPIRLTPEQRESFLEITRNGHAPVKKVRHAQILLWSDLNCGSERQSSRAIAERLAMHVNTVDRIRKQFVLEGEGPALNRKVRLTPAIPQKIDGHIEAHLIAICTGPAPEGRTRWTLTLLAQELKRKGLVTSVSVETVRQKLKKMRCNRGASSAGAFPIVIRPGLSHRWKTSLTSTRTSTLRKSR